MEKAHPCLAIVGLQLDMLPSGISGFSSSQDVQMSFLGGNLGWPVLLAPPLPGKKYLHLGGLGLLIRHLPLTPKSHHLGPPATLDTCIFFMVLVSLILNWKMVEWWKCRSNKESGG